MKPGRAAARLAVPSMPNRHRHRSVATEFRKKMRANLPKMRKRLLTSKTEKTEKQKKGLSPLKPKRAQRKRALTP